MTPQRAVEILRMCLETNTRFLFCDTTADLIERLEAENKSLRERGDTLHEVVDELASQLTKGEAKNKALREKVDFLTKLAAVEELYP